MKPKQFFFGLLAGLIVTVGLGGTGYYYALSGLNAKSAKLSAQLAQQDADAAQIDSLISLKHQYDKDIIPMLDRMAEALPRTKNQTQILTQLQHIATDSGLALSDAVFLSPVGLPSNTTQTIKSGDVLALPVTFQVQGSFTQLQTFLVKIESLSRLTKVTNLAIARPDKSRPIIYSINLYGYVKP